MDLINKLIKRYVWNLILYYNTIRKNLYFSHHHTQISIIYKNIVGKFNKVNDWVMKFANYLFKPQMPRYKSAKKKKSQKN